jgi:hypothetical protein
MSETPRTDSQFYDSGLRTFIPGLATVDWEKEPDWVVKVDFARELERELVEMEKRAAEAVKILLAENQQLREKADIADRLETENIRLRGVQGRSQVSYRPQQSSTRDSNAAAALLNKLVAS